MRRQHVTPYIVRDNQVHRLESITDPFDEGWLQQFVFRHSASIPINEIEPAFGPLIPVCRELPTKAGPIDMLFVSQTGLLTLVECKLWKNPEARREVVGQILDYAKEISQWPYEALQEAAGRALKNTGFSLYQLVCQHTPEIDEGDFIDSVSRNLRRGRFLLLIVGDGIKENVQRIAGFLQEYAHLNFSFALVEFTVFKLPGQDSEFFVQPRLVAQTIEVERAVVRIDDDRITALASIAAKAASTRKRTKISEQVFFENLQADEDTKDSFRTFLEKIQNIGVYAQPGDNSLMLKSELYELNLGIFNVGGDFYNRGVASTMKDMGLPHIGESYLREVAGLFDNGIVDSTAKERFTWTVKVKQGSKTRNLKITEIMAVQDKWIEIIQKTLDDISRASAS